ncbi:MAG: stalk domain-containing protein [Bacillota bacterium]
MKRFIRSALTTAFVAMALMLGTEIASAGLLSVNLGPVQNTVNKTQNTLNTEQQKNNQGLLNLIFAPSNLTATSHAGKVILTWEDNSNNETAFMIERKYEGGTFLKVAFAAANATSCEQSQLSNNPVYPGEKYYYRVKAINDNGGSDYSNEVSVVVSSNTYIAPPTMLKAEIVVSVQTHPVKLTWDDNSDYETKFEVQRQKAGCGFEIIGELPTDTTEYRDTSTLEKDVEYTYRIKVIDGSASAYSNYSAVTMPSSAPSAPRFFSSVALGPTSIKLSWKDTSDNETGFWIGRKKTYSGEQYPPSTNPDFELGPNVTEVIDTGLYPDTEYSYIIAAHNALYSSFVAETKATTGPKAPILTAAAVSSGEICLTWVNQSNNLDTYEIERKSDGGSYNKLATLNSPWKLSYSDQTVSPGKTYYYRIKAWRVWYPSDYSQEVSVTVPELSVNRGQYTINPQDHNTVIPITGTSAGKKVISLNIGQTAYRVNDEIRHMDTAPVAREGRTMLPIRYVTEPLGAGVAWDEATKKVTVKLGDRILELWIGKSTARVNGQEVMIDPDNPMVMPYTVPPGRTMLPVRFISENLGCRVEWNNVTQEARLTYIQ